jgi:inward rectifier potassium channel
MAAAPMADSASDAAPDVSGDPAAPPGAAAPSAESAATAMASAASPPRPSRPLDMRRDVVRLGERRGPFHDLYARLLRVRWSTLVLLLAAAYLSINTLFACIYLLAGDAIENADPGSFLDAFSFSVQTLATIGYGAMSPRGAIGHILVATESFLGLLAVALTTGLVFAKFARPRAAILFSRRCVVGPRNGRPCLMLRVANGRGSDIADASIRMTVLVSEVTQEGERLGRFHDLHLERSTSPLLLMTWLVIHPLDERSPLHRLGPDELRERRIQIFAAITGIDGIYHQTVYSYQLYTPDDIEFGARFADVLRELPDGRRELDLRKLHDILPLR